MADCGVYESLILESIDGRLEAAGHEQLRAHLATCAGCREFQAIQTDLESLLAREITEPAAPLDLERRVRNEMARDRWRARLEALLTVLEPVAAMAVVVVLGHWLTSVATAASARFFHGG
jgi:anti-sigma factor RsiW